MTPKQKLKSIEKKMERLQFNNDRINLQQASRYFADIKRYNELEKEHFFLKFQIEHCQTCGKKL
jgi:multidrug resistance efflux pump